MKKSDMLRVLPALLLMLLTTRPATAQFAWHRVYPDTGAGHPFTESVRLIELVDGGFYFGAKRFYDSFEPINFNHIALRTDPAGFPWWMRYDSVFAGTPLHPHSQFNDAVRLGNGQLLEAWDLKAANSDFSIGLVRIQGNGAVYSVDTLPLPGPAYGSRLFPAANGAVLGLGKRPESFIFKLDAAGVPLWTRPLFVPSDSMPRANRVLETADGGYVALVDSFYQPNQSSLATKAHLIKYHASGHELWRHELIDNIGGIGQSSDVVELPGGDLLTAHQFRDDTIINAVVFRYIELNRLSAAGNLLWSKILHIDDSSNCTPGRLLRGADDFLYLLASSTREVPGSGRRFVIKLDPAAGDTVWTRDVAGGDFIRLADGCFALGRTDLITVPGTGTVPVLAIDKLCPDGTVAQAAVYGNVLGDFDLDCVPTPADVPLSNVIVQFTNPGWLSAQLSAADGAYAQTLDSGFYDIDLFLPGPYWEPCDPDPSVQILPPYDSVALDFLFTPSIECPYMTVDIGVPGMRRCFSNTFTVQYANAGTAAAEDAYVELTFHPLLIVQSATLPYTTLPNNVFRFALGDLPIQAQGSFQVQALVDCAAELNQTLCVSAHIYPDSLCTPPNPAWSLASLEVRAACTGDSVRFTVHNKGLGDMPASQNFIVIEDDAILMTTPFVLTAGDSLVETVAATGHFLRGETRQVEFHPGASLPSAWVEGCGGPASLGYAIQFPLNDGDDYLERECLPVVGSYDPNDKTGYPTGIGAERLLAANIPLDYVIRFQNTGTDTAFTVVVRDTLPAALDWTTLRPGASSHPYTWNFVGPGVVDFFFQNILLPDSNVNEPASHGFIKFEIDQLPDLPDGTLLLNGAAIYFDFNEAVLTNTTLHTIGELPVGTTAEHPLSTRPALLVRPNPLREAAIVEFSGPPGDMRPVLSLYDVDGRVVQRRQFTAPATVLQRGNLPAGVYGLRIKYGGRTLATSTVVIID